MNYLQHLQNFIYIVEKDKRIKPSHISLYIALFHTWNHHHFAPSFLISRSLLMTSSHIDSENTITETLKELHEYRYIIYQPELHNGHSPKVTMIRFTNHKTRNSQLELFSD